MPYVLLSDDGSILKYPYGVSELKTDNPNVSFPIDFESMNLSEWNVYYVTPTKPNGVINYTKKVTEGIPEYKNGQWYQTWIIADLTGQDLEDAKMLMKANVKEEANARILNTYPLWKQSNMTARAVELQDIWRIKQSWSTTEQQEATDLKAAWTWIKNIRQKSDLLEAMDPIPDDYTDDSYWTI